MSTQLPPVVYAPTMTADDGQTRIRMHRMRDDRTALFVYSAIDRLEDQYGEGYPWILLSQAGLAQAHDQAPFDMVFLDRPLHPEEATRG